jgi:hypothetical protein
MEAELARLIEQREQYLMAARTSSSRTIALRRLLSVERLNDEIESLQEALVAFDDMTAPIMVDVENSVSKRIVEISVSRRITGLGPVTPPAFSH